jgi:hypothetical protein
VEPMDPEGCIVFLSELWSIHMNTIPEGWDGSQTNYSFLTDKVFYLSNEKRPT